ncbi:DoxX family protein [Chitinophaga nivalis]|uniref:DoxX family protein n=1 Tax=Chitinophaga nivalis TaxID=2991709 RepID=A0ABT3IQJ2_9BACT|nr:DoxX family protein [Chitinophaga nivalis]MCW3464169.1 DoxX family protein [Chitinophaga nivalis]MCW3486141.1 DoxX family protein [Chitinophaga nivalis]
MKKINTAYWIFTLLLSLLMIASAIPDILAVPEAEAYFKQLGYPAYLLPFLGIAKLLGITALLFPGFPRLKEWAYAGLAYDLTGALYSGIATGTPMSGWTPILIGYVLIAGSYIFHHKRLAARMPVSII